MFRSFSPGMLGIKEPLEKLFALAKEGGFEGLDLSMKSVQDFEAAQGPGTVKRLMAEYGLKPGFLSGLLPVRLSAEQKEWDDLLACLAPRAALGKELGFTRTFIVMLPFHECLAFDACYALSLARLRQAGAALAPFGIRIGVEYVSQPTRRAGQKHEFLYDMAGTLRLLDEAGAPNVGLLLDSFHWHCAGETPGAVAALPASRIVSAHLADAPQRPLAEQVAFERALPGEGVADLAGFCDALKKTGFDGPVSCEPFWKPFESMPALDVSKRVGAVLRAYIP
ncbi:MAG: sugar phosphate isomerase/epimerase [Spirochaetes bacterium]|nr:sugar phosphate isomerase/epimerase [Spirochaetota bacterium]